MGDVCGRIRCKAAHDDIRDELSRHIEDAAELYAGEGLAYDDAVSKAIAQMGDACDVGNRLDKQHRPQTEWSLLLLTLAIAAFGAVIMYICSVYQEDGLVNYANFIGGAVLGAAVLIGAYFFDYTKLYKYSGVIYVMFIVAMFVGKIIIQRSTSWDSWNTYNTLTNVMTMSHLAVIPFAGILCKYKNGGWGSVAILIALMLLSIVVSLMFPSVANAFILCACFAIVVTVAVVRGHFKGKRSVYLIGLYGLGLAFIASLSFILQDRIKDRITQFFSLFISRGKADPFQSGWMLVQADKWLSLSQLFGGAGTSDVGYTIYMELPATSTEYVLVNIIASLGWIAGLALMIIIGAFILRLFRTTVKVKNSYGFYLSLSVCVMLSIKFVLNILINFSLFPIVAIGLPLVSYGVIDYVATMLLIGTVLSVWRRNNIIGNRTKEGIEAAKPILYVHEGKVIFDLKRLVARSNSDIK